MDNVIDRNTVPEQTQPRVDSMANFLNSTNTQRSPTRQPSQENVKDVAEQFSQLTSDKLLEDELLDLETLSLMLLGQQASQLTQQEFLALQRLLAEIQSKKINPKLVLADESTNKMRQNSLPKGALGAFIPGKSGKQGTILLSPNLTPKQRKQVLREEFGEAISARGKELGLDIAPGDAGARVASAFRKSRATPDTHPNLYIAKKNDGGSVVLNGERVRAAFSSTTTPSSNAADPVSEGVSRNVQFDMKFSGPDVLTLEVWNHDTKTFDILHNYHPDMPETASRTAAFSLASSRDPILRVHNRTTGEYSYGMPGGKGSRTYLPGDTIVQNFETDKTPDYVANAHVSFRSVEESQAFKFAVDLAKKHDVTKWGDLQDLISDGGFQNNARPPDGHGFQYTMGLIAGEYSHEKFAKFVEQGVISYDNGIFDVDFDKLTEGQVKLLRNAVSAIAKGEPSGLDEYDNLDPMTRALGTGGHQDVIRRRFPEFLNLTTWQGLPAALEEKGVDIDRDNLPPYLGTVLAFMSDGPITEQAVRELFGDGNENPGLFSLHKGNSLDLFLKNASPEQLDLFSSRLEAAKQGLPTGVEEFDSQSDEIKALFVEAYGFNDVPHDSASLQRVGEGEASYVDANIKLGAGDTKVVEAFDPVTGKWTQIASNEGRAQYPVDLTVSVRSADGGLPPIRVRNLSDDHSVTSGISSKRVKVEYSGDQLSFEGRLPNGKFDDVTVSFGGTKQSLARPTEYKLSSIDISVNMFADGNHTDQTALEYFDEEKQKWVTVASRMKNDENTSAVNDSGKAILKKNADGSVKVSLPIVNGKPPIIRMVNYSYGETSVYKKDGKFISEGKNALYDVNGNKIPDEDFQTIAGLATKPNTRFSEMDHYDKGEDGTKYIIPEEYSVFMPKVNENGAAEYSVYTTGDVHADDAELHENGNEKIYGVSVKTPFLRRLNSSEYHWYDGGNLRWEDRGKQDNNVDYIVKFDIRNDPISYSTPEPENKKVIDTVFEGVDNLGYEALEEALEKAGYTYDGSLSDIDATEASLILTLITGNEASGKTSPARLSDLVERGVLNLRADKTWSLSPLSLTSSDRANLLKNLGKTSLIENQTDDDNDIDKLSLVQDMFGGNAKYTMLNSLAGLAIEKARKEDPDTLRSALLDAGFTEKVVTSIINGEMKISVDLKTFYSKSNSFTSTKGTIGKVRIGTRVFAAIAAASGNPIIQGIAAVASFIVEMLAITRETPGNFESWVAKLDDEKIDTIFELMADHADGIGHLLGPGADPTRELINLREPNLSEVLKTGQSRFDYIMGVLENKDLSDDEKAEELHHLGFTKEHQNLLALTLSGYPEGKESIPLTADLLKTAKGKENLFELKGDNQLTLAAPLVFTYRSAVDSLRNDLSPAEKAEIAAIEAYQAAIAAGTDEQTASEDLFDTMSGVDIEALTEDSPAFLSRAVNRDGTKSTLSDFIQQLKNTRSMIIEMMKDPAAAFKPAQAFFDRNSDRLIKVAENAAKAIPESNDEVQKLANMLTSLGVDLKPSPEASPESGEADEESGKPSEDLFDGIASTYGNMQARFGVRPKDLLGPLAEKFGFGGDSPMRVSFVPVMSLWGAGTEGGGGVGKDGKVSWQVRARVQFNKDKASGVGGNPDLAWGQEEALDLRFKLKSEVGGATRVEAIQIVGYGEQQLGGGGLALSRAAMALGKKAVKGIGDYASQLYNRVRPTREPIVEAAQSAAINVGAVRDVLEAHDDDLAGTRAENWDQVEENIAEVVNDPENGITDDGTPASEDGTSETAEWKKKFKDLFIVGRYHKLTWINSDILADADGKKPEFKGGSDGIDGIPDLITNSINVINQAGPEISIPTPDNGSFDSRIIFQRGMEFGFDIGVTSDGKRKNKQDIPITNET